MIGQHLLLVKGGGNELDGVIRNPPAERAWIDAAQLSPGFDTADAGFGHQVHQRMVILFVGQHIFKKLWAAQAIGDGEETVETQRVR